VQPRFPLSFKTQTRKAPYKAVYPVPRISATVKFLQLMIMFNIPVNGKLILAQKAPRHQQRQGVEENLQSFLTS
jgi:hypothetical protein